MIEIERKYLIKDSTIVQGLKGKRIVQAYLSTDQERAVRVRIKNQKGFLTIKGKSSDDGTSRMEWEKEISLKEAEQLISLALPGLIDKIRYEIQLDKHLWEIDVFRGTNEGLILAEVELKSATEEIKLPDWIDKEVTGDPRYYNSYLTQNPFTTW